MLGQLVIAPRGRGRAEEGRLYGLPVLRTEVDRSGFWGERRLRRAGQALRRSGVRRVLTAPEFDRWPFLERLGLRPVDPEPFVRSQAVPLVLELLDRRGVAPDRATVALRSLRAGREMARTAAGLCAFVRNLIIDAPVGGEELASWLRRELGVPILPPGETGHTALRFQADCPRREEGGLDLYGPRPGLAGLALTAPTLAEEDREDLSLLAALWEGGKLSRSAVKIT